MKKTFALLVVLLFAVVNIAIAQEDEPDYLCFEVIEGTTVSLNGYANPNIQYSFDKKTWSKFSELTVENDCNIYFKGVNPNGFSTSRSDYSSFEVSDEFKCSGNVMSLIDGLGETTTIPNDSYCFRRLFAGCPLTSAPELPATTLSASCYSGMFEGCTSLTTAPELPATTLANSCYSGMFEGCTSLSTAPELPATTLSKYCYLRMFDGCTSLTTAPNLPATTLVDECYEHMFLGCTSLTTAPALPATKLAPNCYLQMFSGCTSLTTAPELPATTLVDQCYDHMFSGCTSLTTAPELPATKLAEFCYSSMFSGCTSLTTAPALPATKLAEYCYSSMFWRCTSLTTAPELPATKLADRCYYSMFSGCTSLTVAPELPATTLAEDCYREMFDGCNRLKIIVVAFNSWPEDGFYNWNGYVWGAAGEGMFICPPDLPQKIGEDYIPKGWAVVYSTDENSKNILTDEYSQTDKSKAQIGDVVNVTFTKRNGYNLTSATFNGTALSISNYKSSFTMTSQYVVIETVYTPIEYMVACVDKYVSANKTKATIADKVTFTIANRASDGYKLDKVTINDQVVSVSNYTGSFEMKDYLSNVMIKATYSKNDYSITTDSYSTADKTSANFGDKINVTFTKIDGYNLTSATCNGTVLSISDYKSSFTMPAANVEIKTVYTPIDYSKIDFLCFKVKAGTTVSLKKFGNANPNIQYSFDKKSWSDFSELTVENDCNIYFKGANPNGFSTSRNDYSSFEVSDEFNCSGNVMSLIDGVGLTTAIPNDLCCFYRLFAGCPLTTAPELPATTLAASCYSEMFCGCTSLTTVPELPATTLAGGCYREMFMDCTSLTTAPELPATTLANYCYYRMFYECTRLTNTPELPATTLAVGCYSNMFCGCTSLTTAPQLPATTLAEKCYSQMFWRCTSLTTAPELPATTLAQGCYEGMFYGCSLLKNITVAFNTWPEKGFSIWVTYIEGNGVFVCPSDLPQQFGINYIPEGWVVNPQSKNFIISSQSEFVTIDKTSAKYNDKVNFSIADRTSDGYKLVKVLINNKEVAVSNYAGSFDMMDYLSDVSIQAIYSKTNYLCFEVKMGTTVSLKKFGNANPNIQYSFDKRAWSDFSGLTVENDCFIYFKGVNPNGFSTSYSDYSSFEVSDEFKCSGNVMSLIDGVGETTAIPNSSFCCFYRLFAGCHLSSAPELPATTLSGGCYRDMFTACTSLTTAPELPATTLANYCYTSMFCGCTSLTTAPELPATTLAQGCYWGMFSSCTGLSTAPDLPATVLAKECYRNMFSTCTSLTTAPELPVTIMAQGCYQYMFEGCTSLTIAPELPATILAAECYWGMFSGCTSLTTAPQLPATTLTQSCYYCMFNGCTNLSIAPKLPATTLAQNCYSCMFYVCTGLTTAPDLSATTLAELCYERMFYGCTSLTTAPKLPAATLAERCYEGMFGSCSQLKNITVALNSWPENGFERWVSGVSDKGVFICPSDLPQKFGENYIPEGWIVNPQNKYFIISSQSEFVTIDKTSAKYNDIVNFSIADRTSEGYKLVKVLVNDKVFAVSNYAGSFDMMDYLSDVTISAQYSKISYTITADEYSQVANTTATVDDAITVTFKQREGFDLTSATCNGNPLNIKDYKATFTMPAQDVEIKTVYTEKEYEIEKPSEGVSVSQPSAKAGDEITISVSPKDGYTVHLYVNGVEVALNGNSAVYTMPSGKIEITVKYVVEEKTPISEIELDNCAVSVFPNPAKSGEEITLKVGGKFDMNNAKIYLYNASGSLVMQIDNVKEYNQLTLRSGVYVGVLVTKGGKKTFRVAVK